MIVSKTAFLFPGQGAQSVGMMSDLAAASGLVRSTFDEASSVLGYDLWTVAEQGPEERLNETQVTQPALLAAGIATWRIWRERGGKAPDFMAGHSLGEYTALVAAGALDFDAAIALVARRGEMMQQATPAGSGAMAAVLGLDDDVLASVCEKASDAGVVSCANFNSPGQIVIAGETAAVERACALAGEAGARRAVPLAVSVPSHCALMAPAAEGMRAALEQAEIRVPQIPVLHNVDTGVRTAPDGIRAALVEQLYRPVRWADTVRRLAGDGVLRMAECGPGRVLAGLNRRISRDIETVALTGIDTIEKTLDEWS
ncbi:MAG: ACP S-malonyltransferase [Xanthomonadales bacterium]